ncbi:MAG: hypothetical protein CUN56_02460 [Phototrophicales bacterium]|nr:MAG: hypothetical protein CUN56_02460 [Phototrophicales bacterium]RMG72987.1 MAG: hypothetical protein D6711_11910 [Chloroflexota bacterium]
MARESLRGFLQIAFFLVLAGICSALAVPKDSPEFVVSVCSSVIGILLLVAVVGFWRILK